MKNDNITRICLWSGPRNISTALMYSFAQRNDTTVFDEPLYAHYLNNTKADEYHPGAKDILESMENDGNKVIEMMLGRHKSKVVFFKNMTHHILNLDRSFMKDVVNIILTRDPIEMLPSFDKVIKNPTIGDVGYELHTELIGHFHKVGIKPIILDSKQILINPKKELNKLCSRIGISFDDQMLIWNPKARKEDGVWAKYWYTNIHNSNGFMKYQSKKSKFPERLIPLLNECQLHYNQLIKGIN